MKKVSLILAAFALVLGLSQCKKEEKPAQSGEKQHIVLTASNGNDGSKVAVEIATAAMNLTWETDDEITVSGGAVGTLHLVSGEGKATATFEGEVTTGDGSTVYFTVGSAPESFAGQTGTKTDCATWIQEHNHFVGTSDYQESGNYNVQMNLQYAVLKLDVSALGTSGAMTIKVGETLKASVTEVSEIASEVFVAVPADGTKKTYTISCDGKIATKTWTLKKNVFYTKAGAEGVGTGGAVVITPMFTIDGDGTMVEFAPGNLWYGTATGESTPAFHFEANQWSTTPTSNGTWDASHVSHFYWSKDARVGYAAKYNEANSQYGITPKTGDVFFTDDPEDKTKPNPNFQVNGETGTWRNLSNAEWNYLLSSRTNASSLRAWVTLVADDVNVSGLVILPDGSKATASDVTTPSALADAGAVFLPAAGYRSDTKVSNVGSCGNYWSSTPNGSDRAYFRFFDSGSVNPDLFYRSLGCAVRLVR